MTKSSEATTPIRRPFTPRVTRLSEQAPPFDAMLEFDPEPAPAPAPPAAIEFEDEAAPVAAPAPPPIAIVLPAPMPIACAPTATVGSRAPKRLLWLAGVIAFLSTLGWMALRDPGRAQVEEDGASVSLEAASFREAVGEPVPVAEAPDLQPPSGIGDEDAPRSREAGSARAARSAAAAPRPRDAGASTAVFHGVLVIDSEPAGARVYVNGEAVGSTPLALDKVTAGSRVVRIEAAGYEPWSIAVRVVANERTEMRAILRR